MSSFASSVSWVWTIIAAFVSLSACAVSVTVCWRAFRVATEIRSLNSLQDEIADAVHSSALALAAVRRVEGRQTRALRGDSASPQTAESQTAEQPPVPGAIDKAALRRHFGLIPGQPARHKP